MPASALGLSHALGHKLGAAYSIPHGITSVRTPRAADLTIPDTPARSA